MKTQKQTILTVLKKGGNLTVAKALTKFGIYALSQRCGELRREGHPIKSTRVTKNNKTFASYSL